jgi:hypothetical protein
LKEHVGLQKEPTSIGVIDEVDPRIDLRIRRETAQLGRQIGFTFVERADAYREPAVDLETFGLILPVDNIDDAGHARCVIRCGWIIDDLDALNATGRNAVEPGLVPDAREARLLAIDEDRNAIAAAELDLTFLADRYAGQSAHCVEHGARRTRNILA